MWHGDLGLAELGFLVLMSIYLRRVSLSLKYRLNYGDCWAEL